MKKIALVANATEWILGTNKNYGGGNVVAANIFRVLKEQNYEITIIAKGNSKDEKDSNVTFKYINHPIGSKEFTEEAEKEAKKCDITINFMTQNILDGTILQSHSYLYRTTRTNKLLQPIKRFLYKKKINKQKQLYSTPIKYAFAVSNGIKDDFKKNFGIENIKVSYPGCKRVYENFDNTKNEVLTFGLIGNSSINKSGNYCILALWFAKLMGLNFHFKLIAPKYDKAIIMKFLLLVSGLKKDTEILPKQEDMTDFYKSIDCVIMPSIHESFGLVPLEAMSFCKTCIVSNNIGFAELIDEASGFKFNRLSFVDFVKTILKFGEIFYKEPEKLNNIRKNGWEISKEHSWETFVDKLLN